MGFGTGGVATAENPSRGPRWNWVIRRRIQESSEVWNQQKSWLTLFSFSKTVVFNFVTLTVLMVVKKTFSFCFTTLFWHLHKHTSSYYTSHFFPAVNSFKVWLMERRSLWGPWRLLPPTSCTTWNRAAAFPFPSWTRKRSFSGTSRILCLFTRGYTINHAFSSRTRDHIQTSTHKCLHSGPSSLAWESALLMTTLPCIWSDTLRTLKSIFSTWWDRHRPRAASLTRPSSSTSKYAWQTLL